MAGAAWIRSVYTPAPATSGSLPNASDLGGAVGIDDTLRMHLHTFPPWLHPLPALPIIPINLHGILEVRQLTRLHPGR